MTTPLRILLVDDDEGLLRLLSMRLSAAGYTIGTAHSGEQAMALLPHQQPHLVITDLRMDGMDGMALFELMHAQQPALPIIILTAHGTIPDAVEATRRGVFGFLTKPFDSRQLLDAVERAVRLAGHSSVLGDDAPWREEIICRSRLMEETLRQAKLIADSEANVLIQSESGTGKELLARALHRASRRSHAPFVAVNCSAMPEALLESELFGHQRGAFTGAASNHKGLFETAGGGTLFLDEIGDMPLPFQAKLLRVLQEGEMRPVGGNQTVSVDVRVISATHRDLDLAIAEQEFRADLYYRLNVVRLELPPLRERREDIPLLAQHFLSRACKRSGRNSLSFSPEAIEHLLSANFPGNVRQLQNVVEQAAALCTGDMIPASLVQHALRQDSGSIPSLAEARDRFERDYLEKILQLAEGNVSNAARMAGRNRTEFYKLLKRHHLDPELFRQA